MIIINMLNIIIIRKRRRKKIKKNAQKTYFYLLSIVINGWSMIFVRSLARSFTWSPRHFIAGCAKDTDYVVGFHRFFLCSLFFFWPACLRCCPLMLLHFLYVAFNVQSIFLIWLSLWDAETWILSLAHIIYRVCMCVCIYVCRVYMWLGMYACIYMAIVVLISTYASSFLFNFFFCLKQPKKQKLNDAKRNQFQGFICVFYVYVSLLQFFLFF